MPNRFGKRHYEALAAIMAATRPNNVTDVGAPRKWDQIVDLMGEKFQDDNPRFVPVWFRSACGGVAPYVREDLKRLEAAE